MKSVEMRSAERSPTGSVFPLGAVMGAGPGVGPALGAELEAGSGEGGVAAKLSA